MKSPPVAMRRRCASQASTPASSTAGPMSWMRRMPATSGTVSMSKARTGVMSSAARPTARTPRANASCGEDARGQVAVAAIANDEHDRGILDGLRDAQGNRAGAARGDAAEDALLAREAPCRVLGVALRDVLDPVDAAGIEDLRQVRCRPLADAGNRRAFVRLGTHDLDR